MFLWADLMVAVLVDGILLKAIHSLSIMGVKWNVLQQNLGLMDAE